MDSIKTSVCFFLGKIKQYDDSTYLHSVRVANLSLFIGECIDLTADELGELSYSAYLHDLGKMYISKSILTHPGKLLDADWKALRKHPNYALRLLKPIREKCSQAVIKGIISHHEYFNGDGYPNKLKGERIPLFGRVIAIADAFDAMVSYRPYRQQVTLGEAAVELLDKAEMQFDPFIVRRIMAHQTEIVHRAFYSQSRINVMSS